MSTSCHRNSLTRVSNLIPFYQTQILKMKMMDLKRKEIPKPLKK